HCRDDADDRKPRPAAFDGGGEGVELAEEEPGRWQADEAENEEADRESEARPLPPEACEAVKGHRPGELALAGGDDGERADVHGRVRDEVVKKRASAERGPDGDWNQHEAG